MDWIYREERDVEGCLVSRVHRSAVTKNYSPCAPITDGLGATAKAMGIHDDITRYRRASRAPSLSIAAKTSLRATGLSPRRRPTDGVSGMACPPAILKMPNGPPTG